MTMKTGAAILETLEVAVYRYRLLLHIFFLLVIHISSFGIQTLDEKTVVFATLCECFHELNPFA